MSGLHEEQSAISDNAFSFLNKSWIEFKIIIDFLYRF